jgi:hypothetical protein
MNNELTAQRTDEESRLIHSPNLPNLFKRLEPWITGLVLIVCLGAFLYHFNVIRKTSVDIPYWDDWAMFTGSHPASLDLSWLYEQANDHRTATTKLFVWLLFRLDGWNLRTHLLLNFLIYGFCVAWLVWLARKMAPNLPPWVILGFAVFYMTPIAWIVHVMGYGTADHFWLLFMLIATYCLFREPQRWDVLVLGCVASILSIYSFAAGVATAVVLLTGFSLFKSLRAYSANDSKVRRRELLHLLLVAGLIGSALAVWIIGWKRTEARLPWVLPYDLRFWTFFLNLVALSFGIERISAFWGLICLFIVITPVCWIVAKKRTDLPSAHWASLVLVTAFLANLVLISIGRAEYGIQIAKYSHYAEHGMPLIILSVINWSLLLAARPRIKAFFIAVLWLFCLMTFIGDWDFGIYQKIYADKLEGSRCVQAYYERGFERSGAEARCPTVFPWPAPMGWVLDLAKKQNPSFYRELTEKR